MLATVLSASANEADKAVAINELWRLRCPELVQAIKTQASGPPLGDLTVGLYTMARELPIEVLMRCVAAPFSAAPSGRLISCHPLAVQCAVSTRGEH
jgi:hypothetical protein